VIEFKLQKMLNGAGGGGEGNLSLIIEFEKSRKVIAGILSKYRIKGDWG
jgi:hypothetical protein